MRCCVNEEYRSLKEKETVNYFIKIFHIYSGGSRMVPQITF